MAPTLVTSCTALPPKGVELRLGRHGASFVAPTPVTSLILGLTGVLAFSVTDLALRLPAHF